jgi:hypothetical protein
MKHKRDSYNKKLETNLVFSGGERLALLRAKRPLPESRAVGGEQGGSVENVVTYLGAVVGGGGGWLPVERRQVVK